MISCERPSSYVERAIRSFRQGSDLPLTVFVDGKSDSYIWKLRMRGIRTITSPVAPPISKPGTRCRLNTLRALRHVGNGQDLLLLEDDVELAERWHERLRPALRHCHEHYGDRFVLALYAATRAGKREGPVAGYSYRDYCGNVAVVLSSAAVAGLLEHAEHSDAPSDMLVKHWAWSTKAPLRQICPNLAQHFGDVSTTGVTRIVRSASFRMR